jgi:hypothetical protein
MAEQPLKLRFLLHPDLDRPIGGGKQVHRQVEQLVDLGWDAAVMAEKAGFRPGWFESKAPVLAYSDCRASGELASSHTILVLPETCLGIDLGNYYDVDLRRQPRVVFNQNVYYSTMGAGTKSLEQLAAFYDAPEVLQVLCVSEDSYSFLRDCWGISDRRLSRIINAVEPHFRPDINKQKCINWLPRKNADHCQALLLCLRRGRLEHAVGWQAEALDQLNHSQLAERLNAASLFLSFGHPEGFGLPVAEAMAAGCYVVGYSGGGGQELFRHGASESVAFGDWHGFRAAVQRALLRFHQERQELQLQLHRQAKAIRHLYSAEQERASIALAWERIRQAHRGWLAQLDQIAP